MQLTIDDLRKVAGLSKLEFPEAELAAFAEQMAKIVTFVEQLGEVPTDGVAEMAHPMDVHSVLRADVNRSGLSRDAALRNAPSSDGEYFLVPPVLGKK